MHGTLESALRVEWRPLAELGASRPQWSELAKRAIEPNVFYEPSFAMAAAPLFGAAAGAALVWSHDTPPRLLGLFPARIERRRYGIPLPVLTGWTHPYAPLGSPLVDAAMCEAVISAWFDHIARSPQLPKLVLLPYLPCTGALAAAIDAAVATRNGKSASFARHSRAFLAPSEERETYLSRAIDGKKRKELRRQRKRLADLGSVIFDESAVGSAGAALDDFFHLEARGWKGRAGTAARCQPDVLKFMRAAVTTLAQEDKARVTRLCVDTNPVAALVTLRSGRTAWCWKIAYDETYARFSPGVQILVNITERLLRDQTITRADSCATPEHPMIDHVWRERLELADRLMCIGEADSLRFALACRLEQARRGAVGLAKALRDIVGARRAD